MHRQRASKNRSRKPETKKKCTPSVRKVVVDKKPTSEDKKKKKKKPY